MDNTYADRINYRRSVLENVKRRPDTVSVDEESRQAVYPAVAEIYTWLFSHYLPRRYPKMFRLHRQIDDGREEILVQNLVTGECVPATSRGAGQKHLEAEEMLETMAMMVDEDFFFLIPKDNGGKETTNATTLAADASADSSDDAPLKTYFLAAFSAIASNGFSPAAKLGLPLRAIHTPVPSYEARIAKSMDRFFNKLETGKYVKRANWSIATGADWELFDPPQEGKHHRAHIYDGDQMPEELQELDVQNVSPFPFFCDCSVLPHQAGSAQFR